MAYPTKADLTIPAQLVQSLLSDWPQGTAHPPNRESIRGKCSSFWKICSDGTAPRVSCRDLGCLPAHVDQGSSQPRGASAIPGVGGRVHFPPESIASWVPTRVTGQCVAAWWPLSSVTPGPLLAPKHARKRADPSQKEVCLQPPCPPQKARKVGLWPEARKPEPLAPWVTLLEELLCCGHLRVPPWAWRSGFDDFSSTHIPEWL